ncbi:MAG: hypothetical protein Q9180_005563 [Flavoplaca navasiana]
MVTSPRKVAMPRTRDAERSAPSTPNKPPVSRVSKSSPRRLSSSLDQSVNPWTLAKRPTDTLGTKLPRGTRFSALGIYGSSAPSTPSSCPKEPNVVDMEDSLQLPTPSNSGSRNRPSVDLVETEGPITTFSMNINRKLDFTEHASAITRSRPNTPDSLPSPSMLMSLQSTTLAEDGKRDPPLRHPMHKRNIQANKRTRALLALRESLDGTWRDIQPWEVDRAYVKKVFNSVEVVDLTRT